MAQRRTADAGLTDPARRALLAAAAALPACTAMPPAAGPGAALPSGPAPAPVLRIGDRWRYQLIDKFNGQWLDEPTWEVAELAPELVMHVRGRRAGGPLEERFAAPWSALTEVLYGAPYAFREPVPIVPSPIEPGRTVATSTSYVDSATQQRKLWSQQLRIAGWTTIEVPAGRYDCLRVSRIIAFEHPDSQKTSANRSDTLWYAPAVNRWVQRELRGEFIASGLGAGNPSTGVRGREDWLLWQLTAYTRTPVSG